ncbi:MAG: hypothetical protein ACTSV5_12390 [Promethearchaeota archaeon]
MSVEISAILVVIISAIISIFLLLLAIGMPLGYLAFGGKHEKKLPNKLRIISIIAMGIFIFTSLAVLDLANFISIFSNSLIPTIAIWILAFYFAFNILTNVISKSKWEKRIMVPLSLTLSVCCFIIVILA